MATPPTGPSSHPPVSYSLCVVACYLYLVSTLCTFSKPGQLYDEQEKESNYCPLWPWGRFSLPVERDPALTWFGLVLASVGCRSEIRVHHEIMMWGPSCRWSPDEGPGGLGLHKGWILRPSLILKFRNPMQLITCHSVSPQNLDDSYGLQMLL